MNYEMKEYNDAKALRHKYPVDLTEDHMAEIVALLPSKPARDDMVSLALSHGHEFTTKEIILYWMYQEKLAKSICAECVKELKDIDTPKEEIKVVDLSSKITIPFDSIVQVTKTSNDIKSLARAHGGLLKMYVSNVLKNDGAKNDIDFEKKKELAANIFDTWKNGTPKKFFKLQLVGYKNLVNINIKVFGKTEINDFLGELIK